jgi:hypothetical protein
MRKVCIIAMIGRNKRVGGLKEVLFAIIGFPRCLAYL